MSFRIGSRRMFMTKITVCQKPMVYLCPMTIHTITVDDQEMTGPDFPLKAGEEAIA